MKTLITILLLFSMNVQAKVIRGPGASDKSEPIKVAVIDTGFDFDSDWKKYKNTIDSDGYRIRKPVLCKTGHTDFTGAGLKDSQGHGTHVAGIIAKFAEGSNYCLVILKYYADGDNMKRSIDALKKAIELTVDMINYSGGGTDKSEEECILVKQALDKGIVFVAAAGNEGSNINQKPYYPAMCDNRVIAVANTDDVGNLSSRSNFTDKRKDSRELVEEKGLRVLSLLPNNKLGFMTGTSQATPTYLGKLIKKMKNK